MFELEAHIWASPKHGRNECGRYKCRRYITLDFCDKTRSNCINVGK